MHLQKKVSDSFLNLFTDIIITSKKLTYSVFGKLHRPLCRKAGDKPAEIRADGSQLWYINNKLHRSEARDKPAEIWADGEQRWYKNGKLHRSEAHDKLAEIRVNGTRCWYKNGEIHRSVVNEMSETNNSNTVIQANYAYCRHINGKLR